MGSGSSRMGRRPSRIRPNRKSSFFSSLICGGSASCSSSQMENSPDEIQVNSGKHCALITHEIRIPTEDSSFISGAGTGSISSAADDGGGASPGSYSAVNEGTSAAEHGYRNTETSINGKCLSESKEIVAPCQVSDNHSRSEFFRNRSSAEASTSFKDQESSDVVSVNVSTNKDATNGLDNSENKGVSQICPRNIHPGSSSSQGPGGSGVDGSSVGNLVEEVTSTVHSGHISRRSDGPATFLGDGLQEAIPSSFGLLMANREEGQGDESVVHVDVVSVSSSILSGSNSDTNNREARRSSRRLFWDAFSRRSSRRHLDSPTIVFSTDNTDDLLSHDRWLLDFSGDMFGDGIGSDSGYLSSRIHTLNGRRRHSRSEIWERLRGGLDEHGRRTTFCPSGLHLDGMCSCESFSTTEETSTRASISRIVMLAEALFEVLDEIHRQPLSLSLSTMSLPAPESVVDSFPLKNHKKEKKVEGGDDDEQCYICLAEYEEGDKIRVLPCQHEYHMSCVDKWLKEIHGICPLCRGDVREGANVPSASCNDFSIRP
ncbi:uncharacterized protein LOC126664543 [Mercurialis annua]|uniref:uncharacterized protein LOC126664543 n=1 Tax=Mercurialis annua TaxID=3986 RepID=UPI00215FB279|nr:uncharacterized protein LOC126664543 [Mercurialis annua]